MATRRHWGAVALIGLAVPTFAGMSWWAYADAPLAAGLFALFALAAFVLGVRGSAVPAERKAARGVTRGGPYREPGTTPEGSRPSSAESEELADGVEDDDPEPVFDRHADDPFDRLRLLKLIGLSVPMWWTGALLIVVSTPRLQILDAPFILATVLALMPWGLGFAVLKFVERLRRQRFGPKHARIRWSYLDAIVNVGMATSALVLVVEYIPRAASTHDPMDVGLALVGPVLAWFPVAAVRRCLKER